MDADGGSGFPRARPASASSMADEANVKVFCRVRPPNERELGVVHGGVVPSFLARSNDSAFVKKCVSVPSSDPLQQTVLVHLKHGGQNGAQKMFTFDRVFGEDATQNELFDVVGTPITRACLEGYNGTIFAYGQTGSGKTFTMQGPDDVLDIEAHNLSEREKSLRGLVPRVFEFLFKDNNQGTQSDGAARNVTHMFTCSFLEIYNERVYDLLDNNSTRETAGLQLRENGRKGVFVEGLIESEVANAAKAAELMKLGAQNRRVGQTAMNRESSRSHSVFILHVQSKETTPEGITKTRNSRFNLVDLAGSERQKNTETAGERLKEAGSINKSLSALGNVIMGLVEQSAGKNRHVHYRDSKLTFLLKDSLGGNSKTFMIAAVSPAEDSANETLSTLKFAQRAKMIRNNAVINEDTSGSVALLQEEILRLRRQLQQARIEQAPAAVPVTKATEDVIMTVPTIAQSSSVTLPPACDPVVDERFRELEAAFATCVEKNSKLKRSFEHIQLKEDQLKTLCATLQKKLIHLRMLLRVQQGKCPLDEVDKELEYEPSVDAIDWRIKYDEMEEAYAQLQEQLQSQSGAATSAAIANEVDMHLLALAKQLAAVVRDKHQLQDRLKRVSNGDIDLVDIDMTKAAVEAEIRPYQAKLNSMSAMVEVAEQKASALSLELLESKQREAAMSISNANLRVQHADSLAHAEHLATVCKRQEEELVAEKKRVVEVLSVSNSNQNKADPNSSWQTL
ncbi:TPA: LOW QUALITY PROTEIN: hypothetical protein N0F65_001715 [Lagenidium giganteum]|uniref:Kinesin-like protein n=1 Tax=Lagenidium giganteum TaxID=4803 RepID=A0AAV2Z340_9STRA|nr:TPA: LOW QUALITY PROTEIN: hypothetical protein N0F65_001715 [Lagenidium giganteum]